MPIIKTLQPGDETLLDAFLSQHANTSMFLRSNWRAAGLVDNGARFEGTYVAAFINDEIVAVAAHYWNGMVIPQAPIYLEELVQAAIAQSGRPITGISGPAVQVEATKKVLGLSNQPTQLDESEIIFSLVLENLQVPPALSSGEVQYRLPYAEELELLSQWCADYSVETFGETETPDLHSNCRGVIEARHATASHWVLVAGDMPVSYSAFNARLPDIVQIGGVWTPPKKRGKGYAKGVLAGSLLDARSQGVKRAVLFTGKTNYAAQAAYRGIGFQPTGEEYGLMILKI
jgi:ribosomal protein S18 acetylase RimI-like enzyme